MTSNHRTKINHDWDDLSSADQVWASLGYETPSAGHKSHARNERTLLNLKAAVDMAAKDALSPSWLRTPEQITGGTFPGPWIGLHSRTEVEAFLIEYDVARASAVSYTEMKVQLKSLPRFSPTAYDTLTESIARTHNYTHLLRKHIATSSPSSPVATSDTPVATQSAAEPTKSVPEHPPADQRKTAADPPASVKSVAPSTSLPTLQLGAELDEDTQDYCYQYHRDQEAFEKALRYAPVAPDDKREYDGLFDWKPYTDHKGRSKTTPVTCDNYPRVFAILSRAPDWNMSQEMARKLRGAIFYREQAQKWYQRLPASDPRRDGDGGHQNFIKVLKDGEAVLKKNSV